MDLQPVENMNKNLQLQFDQSVTQSIRFELNLVEFVFASVTLNTELRSAVCRWSRLTGGVSLSANQNVTTPPFEKVTPSWF